ncbi:MAG: hypothetical protein GXY52_02875 [Chloroflexi bacterium]|nr:hypothetical protein [Chloroflexota bacterium]
MSNLPPFETSVAQFTTSPFTRAWPEAVALDAFFRYCVKRFHDFCRANPRAWLTEADLQSLLAGILREELPRHGLPAHAVHQGYSVALRPEGAKTARSIVINISLLIPDTVQHQPEQRGLGVLSLAAAVRYGSGPSARLESSLQQLASLRSCYSQSLLYLVVMAYAEETAMGERAQQAAQAADITLLYDNYRGLAEPVQQERLL